MKALRERLGPDGFLSAWRCNKAMEICRITASILDGVKSPDLMEFVSRERIHGERANAG